MKDIKKCFADNLKEIIGNRSITAFSREVGIPQATLSRYLACKREPTISNLCKIADFCGERIDVLIGRTDY